MKRLETVRFATADDVQLVGWHSGPLGDLANTVVIHIHGMSGNGFENHLVDALREMHNADGRAFFSFNNRGAGVVTWQYTSSSAFLGGACYERFDDCVHDIAGAIDAMVDRGFERVVLQGHSLGCTKVVHYLTSVDDKRVCAAILLAPTDMYGWAHRSGDGNELLARAQQLEPDTLVGERCWDEGPLCASTYLSYATPRSHADIYRNGAFSRVSVPMQIVYGTEDMGIRGIDGTFAQWQTRTKPVLNDNTDIALIEGAEHGFVNHLSFLCNVVHRYLRA